jgi:general secretion pathway protein A
VRAAFFDDQQQAINALLEALKLAGSHSAELCASESTSSPRCEQFYVPSWQALVDYNRPAVLRLITPAKMQVYVTLLAIENKQALLQHGNKTINIPLATIGEMWTGDFLFIWQPSKFYTAPFSEGTKGPIVAWLAQQFAQLDNQPTLLAEQTFNPALAQRVKLFQTHHQLKADGVVGLKTLLKLNQQLGLEQTLLLEAPQPTNNAEEL